MLHIRETSSDVYNYTCHHYHRRSDTCGRSAPSRRGRGELRRLQPSFRVPEAETTKPKAGGNPAKIPQRSAGEPAARQRERTTALRAGPAGTGVSQRRLPDHLSVCVRRRTAAAKLRERKSSVCDFNLLLSVSDWGGRGSPADLEAKADGARGKRRQTLFSRSSEPLARENEAAKEKVGFVPEPREEHRAPRCSSR